MEKVADAGQWTRRGPLDIPRSHPATAVYKDKIYTFGGGGVNFKSFNCTRMYDPASGMWEARADMPCFRSGAVAAAVGDRIYVMGGGFKQPSGTFRFLTTVQIYYPDRDVWEEGPDLLMPHDYPAVAYTGGYIYVMGGHHPQATEGGPQTDPGFDFCERLDPAQGAQSRTGGQWEQIASLPTPRFALTAVVVDGRIMTMGGVAFSSAGFHNFDFVESYDPATHVWVREKNFHLPWTAAGLGACILDGDIFIFGGYSGDGIHNRAAYYDAQGWTSAAGGRMPEAADASQGVWRQISPMPGALAAMGVAVVGKSAYLISGWPDNGRVPTDAFYSYTRD